NLKASIASMGKQLGLNMIFDESVKESKFSIDLQDVTYAKALDLIFLQNKLTFEVVDRKTIFIYADNATNKQRFERFLIKTFYLGNAKHGDVRTALQSFLGAAGGGRIAVSVEPLNAIVVRATAGELQMFQDLISGLDKNRAEVVVDVNIYEISRTDALQIGNQLALTPQTVSETKFDTEGKPVTVQTGQSTSLANLGGIGQLGVAMLAGSTFTPFLGGVGTLFGLPPTGVSLLQTRGRSRLLYNSQVHALDGQQNQTKLGQSVPVKTGSNYGYGGGATVVTPGAPTTGQTGNTGFGNSGLFDNIQYKDVGLVIDVTPTITNEGYVEIKMKLESSSVEESGESSSLTPTFSQRSLTTIARVMDGVTAVVGSVKQDTKGEARATLPFIGMVPILGRFFSTPRETSRDTDLVITVTPHIIRAPEIKSEDHLAQVAGPLQGGLPRSLEDVMQAVKEDEEQEKRMIAKQTQLPAQSSTPTIAGAAPVNTVSSAGVAAAPQVPGMIPIREVQSTPDNGGLANGARLQEANFRPDQTGATPPPAAIPPPAEKQGEAEDKSKKPEDDKSQAAQDPKAQAEKAESDKLAKELQELNSSLVQPPAGVAPARVVAPDIPEDVRERLEKVKAEQLKRDKERKPEPVAEIPEEYRNPRGPQQPVQRAMIRPANRATSTVPTPISVILKSAAKVQLGKSVQVELVVQGQTALAAGLFVVKFDPAKFQVKSVRPGKAAGTNAQVIHEVTGGELKITLSAIDQKTLAAGESLVLIELATLGGGEADLEVQSDTTRLRLPSNGAVQLTAIPVKIQIGK
ncbi:MAG: secretin N-terminal domain-containing protein, partial [Acidobacteriota bacterium]